MMLSLWAEEAAQLGSRTRAGHAGRVSLHFILNVKGLVTCFYCTKFWPEMTFVIIL